MNLSVQIESFVLNVLFVPMFWLILIVGFTGKFLQFFVLGGANILNKTLTGDTLEGSEFQRLHPLFRKAYQTMTYTIFVIAFVEALALVVSTLL